MSKLFRYPCAAQKISQRVRRRFTIEIEGEVGSRDRGERREKAWLMQPFRVNTLDFDAREGTDSFDRLPDTCPRCHQKGTPQVWGSASKLPGGYAMQIPLRCPNRECGYLYLAVYHLVYGMIYDFALRETEPYEFEAVDFGPHITATSERFCETMNQATAAEIYGLNEIAGPGYRKALEVLIKDFAKLPYEAQLRKAVEEEDSVSQADAEKHIAEIERLLLGPCIQRYIDDKRIKDIAERAAWLGNDETHYVRKWPEKDIKALKSLIELVIHFVRSHLEYVAVLEDMPEGRK